MIRHSSFFIFFVILSILPSSLCLAKDVRDNFHQEIINVTSFLYQSAQRGSQQAGFSFAAWPVYSLDKETKMKKGPWIEPVGCSFIQKGKKLACFANAGLRGAVTGETFSRADIKILQKNSFVPDKKGKGYSFEKTINSKEDIPLALEKVVRVFYGVFKKRSNNMRICSPAFSPTYQGKRPGILELNFIPVSFPVSKSEKVFKWAKVSCITDEKKLPFEYDSKKDNPPVLVPKDGRGVVIRVSNNLVLYSPKIQILSSLGVGRLAPPPILFMSFFGAKPGGKIEMMYLSPESQKLKRYDIPTSDHFINAPYRKVQSKRFDGKKYEYMMSGYDDKKELILPIDRYVFEINKGELTQIKWMGHNEFKAIPKKVDIPQIFKNEKSR